MRGLPGMLTAVVFVATAACGTRVEAPAPSASQAPPGTVPDAAAAAELGGPERAPPPSIATVPSGSAASGPSHRPTTAGMPSETPTFAEMAVPAGKTRLGTLQCVEAQICEDGDRIWNDEAPALGFQPVYRARASLAQPDFTAECLRARQAGVQTWIINLDAASLSRLAAACARQGFRPTFGMGSSNAAPHLAKDPNMGELIVGLPYFPWFLRDTPGRRQFHNAMARYAPSLTPSAGHANGWSAAKLMERALRTVSGPVTSEAIRAALWSLRGDDLDGVTAPLTYAPNQNAVRAICWANVTVRDGN